MTKLTEGKERTPEEMTYRIRKYELAKMFGTLDQEYPVIGNIYKSNFNFMEDKEKPKPKYKERIYKTWAGMKFRCLNPKAHNYYRYGGRGIKICDEWLNYDNFRTWAFKNGYQDNLTIDRIDNDGNYEPKNCRWLSIKENVLRSSGPTALNAKKKVCPRGHPLTGENVYSKKFKTGIIRSCRQCARKATKEWVEKNLEYHKKYNHDYWVNKLKAKRALLKEEAESNNK